MLRDNWGARIVNVDYSSVVIDQMKEKYNADFYDPLKAPFNKSGKMPAIAESWEERDPVSPDEEPRVKMEFLCADITEELPFEDGSFDLIMCKGTLDSVLCGCGSVANVKRMMQECCRLLDDHGAMVVVSYGNPDSRIVFFENEGNEWWEKVGVHKVPQTQDVRAGSAR